MEESFGDIIEKDDMAESLLAHLYSHIRGSQEDVATLSLQFILSQSKKLNEVYTKLLFRSLHVSSDESIHYVCQSVGDQLERPDIAGLNIEGKERLLCEAKFFAGLTENQPNTYLDRLRKKDGVGLVFICPSARVVTLWSKLMELTAHRTVENISDYCVETDGIRLSILSWNEIIELLRLTAARESVDSLSDIAQLEGFCRLMETEAFIPFSAEDFGPENARKEERHYLVIDALFDRLISDKALRADSNGLRATPRRYGYIRYIHILGHGVGLIYDRKMWSSQGSVETPFWFVSWTDNKQYYNRYPDNWKEPWDNRIALPLFAPTNASLEEITEQMAAQVCKFIRDLEET